MKVAVTATGPTLDANVDPRFGRCPYFLIVYTNALAFEALENPNAALERDAGVQSAQLVADKGVQLVLTGNCGPKAHSALMTDHIAVLVGLSGPVRKIIEEFKAGRLKVAKAPNVARYFGAGGRNRGPSSGVKTA